MDDIDPEIETILDEIEDESMRNNAEQLGVEEVDQHALSESMNMYQGIMTYSTDQFNSDTPEIVVYAHSPGFTEGEHGHGSLRGRDMRDPFAYPEDGRRVSQNNNVSTGLIDVTVESGEDLPGPFYEDEGVVEVALRHDGIEMREDYPVTLNTLPYDPGSLNSKELEEIIDSYDSDGDGDIKRRGLI